MAFYFVVFVDNFGLCFVVLFDDIFEDVFRRFNGLGGLEVDMGVVTIADVKIVKYNLFVGVHHSVIFEV
jgi:hypothetical protein